MMKQSKGLTRTARYMVYSIGGLFVVFLVVGLLVSTLVYPFEKPLPYTLGLLVGSLSSVGKVLLLQRSIAKTMEQESETAQNYAQMQYLLRFGITIVLFLLIAFLPKWFGIVGGVLGFLSIQLSAYIANFILKKQGYPDEEM